jgi:hypothetical protein
MNDMTFSDGRIDEMDDELNAFAERIARPLRVPERLESTFDERVMSAVHADVRLRAQTENRSWWLRTRTLEISPLAGLAMAAGIAGMMFFGGAMLRRVDAPERQIAAVASRDTVKTVRFVFLDSAAREVVLVGDFNGWDTTRTRLVMSGAPGAWTVSLNLPAGKHEYAFVVRDARGERWVTDPFAPSNRDEFGTESSVLIVGQPKGQVGGADRSS